MYNPENPVLVRTVPCFDSNETESHTSLIFLYFRFSPKSQPSDREQKSEVPDQVLLTPSPPTCDNASGSTYTIGESKKDFY
jgi:hypothetical protein